MASRSIREMADRLSQLAVLVPQAGAAGVAAAAKAVQVAVAVASGRYAGSTLTRTRAVIASSPTPSALVRMTSRKAHLLDHDTREHEIAPRRKPVMGSVAHGFGPVGGAVTHPGTKGKLMWERGVELARPEILAAMDESMGAALVKAILR